MIIPGEHPLPVHRINYFASRWFEGFFDPHPDHPAPPTLAERIAQIAANKRAELPAPEPRRRFTIRRIGAVAATLIAVVAAGWWSSGGRDPKAAFPIAMPPSSASTTAAPSCGGNADDVVEHPIVTLYDAIRAKDLTKYREQWAPDGHYEITAKYLLKSIQEIGPNSELREKWEASHLNVQNMAVLKRSETTAIIEVRYALYLYVPGAVTEIYHLECMHTATGDSWLITRNFDHVQRLNN